MYVCMYVCMYSSLATAENHTQDSSTVQPLTQSLYVLSYLCPTYAVHILLSLGHNDESRLLPQTETRLLSARATYSRTIASSQIYFICAALLVRFPGPQPLPNNTSRA
jgi:hypothetical protein